MKLTLSLAIFIMILLPVNSYCGGCEDLQKAAHIYMKHRQEGYSYEEIQRLSRQNLIKNPLMSTRDIDLHMLIIKEAYAIQIYNNAREQNIAKKVFRDMIYNWCINNTK